MVRICFAALAGLVVALAAASPAAHAKISAMSGAYDGRGKPPETGNAPPAKPKKKRARQGRPGGGAN
jgi:hypothetical protein